MAVGFLLSVALLSLLVAMDPDALARPYLAVRNPRVEQLFDEFETGVGAARVTEMCRQTPYQVSPLVANKVPRLDEALGGRDISTL